MIDQSEIEAEVQHKELGTVKVTKLAGPEFRLLFSIGGLGDLTDEEVVSKYGSLVYSDLVIEFYKSKHDDMSSSQN